jgi:hypothetical protein
MASRESANGLNLLRFGSRSDTAGLAADATWVANDKAAMALLGGLPRHRVGSREEQCDQRSADLAGRSS